jgi:hypothetical protein
MFAEKNASIERGWGGSLVINPKKFNVNPLCPRHPRSIEA